MAKCDFLFAIQIPGLKEKCLLLYCYLFSIVEKKDKKNKINKKTNKIKHIFCIVKRLPLRSTFLHCDISMTPTFCLKYLLLLCCNISAMTKFCITVIIFKQNNSNYNSNYKNMKMHFFWGGGEYVSQKCHHANLCFPSLFR